MQINSLILVVIKNETRTENQILIKVNGNFLLIRRNLQI